MLTRIGCFAFFFSLIFISTCRAAEEADITRIGLKGLRGIAVVIEKIKPELEREGLSELTIRTDVELRLRQSGISVLASTDPSQGRAFLYVVIAALRSQTDTFYAYMVRVSVGQGVVLERDPRIHTMGETWLASPTIGTAHPIRLSADVRGQVRDTVDEFINAYLAVNPKR